MDFLEKAFQKLWNFNAKRHKHLDHEVHLDKVTKSLAAFASSILQPPFQPLLVASNKFVGMHGQQIYLPAKIDFTLNYEVNRQLYLNLVLQMVGARNLKQRSNSRDPLPQRLHFLRNIHQVNRYLDQQFVGYEEFQKIIFEQIRGKPDSGSLNEEVFKVWTSFYLLREPADDKFFIKLLDKIKSNEPVPSFLMMTTPCSEFTEGATFGFSATPNEQNQKSRKKQSEKQKPGGGPVEHVDLEKEPANPVMHSFEKLETAEEYQGGYRTTSGDDELDSHSEALEDLDISKVTTSGEAAQSVYNSDSQWQGRFFEGQPLDRVQETFLYPEWSSKKSKYLSDHCQVFENHLSRLPNNLEFLARVERENSISIRNWKRRIQSLLSDPLWLRRQIEGQELDLDSIVRDFPALLHNRNIEGRWYAHKRAQFQDASVLILFDQSMSADSWIENMRVMDIILESIALTGILFEGIVPEVEIAGTWSVTRAQCNFQIYKGSKEDWAKFYSLAPAIEPQGYTRLGPAIRHAVARLAEHSGGKKLLLILTDGKPTDLDGYEGHYGVYDVRRACLEANSRGVFPFALTVDRDAKQYFSKMFDHYRLLRHPKNLPEEVYKIMLQLIRRSS